MYVPKSKRHRGCIICGQRQAYLVTLRAENARKMRAVYSACLQAHGLCTRQGVLNKQEPPAAPTTEGSTDSNTRSGGVKWSLDRV